MKFYSYDRHTSIVNFSNSILKKYNVTPFHETIEEIDALTKNKKKLCLVLLDGDGEAIQDATLSKKSNLISHRFMNMSSTFPPTTVAATNSLLSGKYPNETGWIGWTTYVEGLNEVVEMFTSKDYVTKKLVSINNVCKGLYPYKTIFELIKEKNPKLSVESVFMLDHGSDNPHTVGDFFAKTDEKLSNMLEGFLYAYCLEPDASLHEYGEDSEQVKTLCNRLDDEVGKLAEKHTDTLFLVIADHAHIKVTPIYCSDYPDFYETLETCFLIEARAASFRIKKGMEKQFLSCYKKYFKKSFALISKKQILKSHLFGYGKNFKDFENILGQYMLIATTDKYFIFNRENEKHEPFVSTHAGGTKRENIISISIFNKRTAEKY